MRFTAFYQQTPNLIFVRSGERSALDNANQSQKEFDLNGRWLAAMLLILSLLKKYPDSF
jgi:hypothetical protein